MQCPHCDREFKNYNSLRVHNYRFHNPNTKYRSARGIRPDGAYNISSDARNAIPVAATVALVASGGGWKKWLILCLVLAAFAIIAWYLVTKDSEKET